MLGIRAVQRAVCLCAPSGGVILRSNFTPGGHAEGVMIFFFQTWHANQGGMACAIACRC